MMKKTLIICGHYPFPENIGANMRTMNFVRFFKIHGSIDIAYVHALDESQIGNPAFSNEYRLETRKFKRYRTGLMHRFMTGVPAPLYQFTDPSKDTLISAIESNDYDFILIRYLYSASIVFAMPEKYRKRIIIDYDDLLSESLYDSLMGSTNGTLKKTIFKIIRNVNKKILQNYEQKCIQASTGLFCSEKDRRSLNGAVKSGNNFVVPNIYDNASFKGYDFGDGFQNENTLLFIGTLNYRPNVEGLRWFIEEIYPGFKQEYPDAKLLVVGRFPNQELKSLCEGNDSVQLYENVPDIKEYYEQCKAVVVPLLSGGGTRIKILEAALAKRPVLSTPIGAEGLDLADENDLLLFENAHDFSVQYSKILDREMYDLCINNAEEAVSKKYSRQRFHEIMSHVVNKLDYQGKSSSI